jgi:hypothetical protein
VSIDPSTDSNSTSTSQSRTPLWVAIVGVGVVVAAVLVTGLAWPGWMTGSGSPSIFSPLAVTQPAEPTAPASSPSADSLVAACPLVSTDQTARILGRTGMSAHEHAPLDNPATGVRTYLCLYEDSGGVPRISIEAAEYPARYSPAALMNSAAHHSVDKRPASGFGDTAEFVSDLGGNQVLSLIVAQPNAGGSRLVTVSVGDDSQPTMTQLSQLAHLALAGHD